MANPIREIGRMAPRTKQPDGMPSGGVAPDVLVVAGALAMRHPDTGYKLDRHAYYLARILYAGDNSPTTLREFRTGAIAHFIPITTEVKAVIALKLFNCAFKEIQSPIMRLNRKTGEQEVKPTSKSEICRRLNIKGNKLPTKVEDAYNAIIQQLFTWNDMALRHVNAAMREDEAA